MQRRTQGGLPGVTSSVNRKTIIGPAGPNQTIGPRRRLMELLGLKAADDTQLIADAVRRIEELQQQGLSLAVQDHDDDATPLALIGLDGETVEALAAHDPPLWTVEALQAYTEHHALTDIAGIGEGRARKITEALEAVRGAG